MSNSKIDDLYENVILFYGLSNEQLFALDYEAVEKLQLHHFRERFLQLRTQLSGLRRLAEDVDIGSISSFDDLASLAFPHTMYISYATGDVEVAKRGALRG